MTESEAVALARQVRGLDCRALVAAICNALQVVSRGDDAVVRVLRAQIEFEDGRTRQSIRCLTKNGFYPQGLTRIGNVHYRVWSLK